MNISYYFNNFMMKKLNNLSPEYLSPAWAIIFRAEINYIIY